MPYATRMTNGALGDERFETLYVTDRQKETKYDLQTVMVERN